MTTMASTSGCKLSRLLSNIFTPAFGSSCSASGRWYPQPDAGRLFSTKIVTQNPPTADVVEPTASKGDSADHFKTPKLGIQLSANDAAPVYYQPKSRGSGFGVEPYKNGELVANYTLYEAAINTCKVPWNDYDGLTSDERTIYMAHLNAVNERKLSYRDPFTGYTVFTVAHHLHRGDCCGNACRHCPFEMKNVSSDVKASKVWNGAYYV